MTIDNVDWQRIDRRIYELIAASNPPTLIQGVVINKDELRNVIWLEEFGDQPIPLFTFDYDVKYYDTKNDGTIQVKKAVVTPKCPNIGDIVLVARQYGSRRLPKCLGVLRSTDFIYPGN